MLAIKNNLMAANAARHLGRSYDALATSVERLSSGLRINGAKDDAAMSWRDSFLIQLKQFIEMREGAAEHTLGDVPLPQDQRSNVRMTLHLVFGKGPLDIFSGIFEDQNSDTLKSNQSAGAGNTLIGLIDRRRIDMLNA